jgi:hypothetical protein
VEDITNLARMFLDALARYNFMCKVALTHDRVEARRSIMRHPPAARGTAARVCLCFGPNVVIFTTIAVSRAAERAKRHEAKESSTSVAPRTDDAWGEQWRSPVRSPTT